MVFANLRSGTTKRFDITCQKDLQTLLDLCQADQITALSLIHQNLRHTLIRPKQFRGRFVYSAELLRDRNDSAVIGVLICVYVADIRSSISLLFDSNVVRYDLVRVGRMQYNAVQRRL